MHVILYLYYFAWSKPENLKVNILKMGKKMDSKNYCVYTPDVLKLGGVFLLPLFVWTRVNTTVAL